MYGFRVTLFGDPETDTSSGSGSGGSGSSGSSSSGGSASSDAKIVDVVDPVWIVEGQSASTDASGKTSANVSLIAVDKYFDSVTATTAELESQIQVLIDGNDISSIAPELEKTLTYVELVKLDEATGTYVTAANSDEAQGARYTFSLSNLEESTSTYWNELHQYEANSSTGRPYREFSGPLQVKVPAGTVKDKSGNTSKELIVDLGNIDAIKPEIIYRYSSSDIDHDNKKAQIVFSVTDKYLKETTSISASDFTIKIDGEEPVWRPESGETGVTRTLTKTAKMVMNKTTGVVSTQSGTYTLTSNERLVGETYTLTLEHLEQLDSQGYGDGDTYSGVVTVVMPNTKFKDETNSSPSATTLTVGINTPEGTGSSQIVDVVDPVWKKGTSTVTTNASGVTTAVVELIAEDKYFSRIVPSTTDALKNMLKVYVAGDDKTSELDITLTGPTSTAKGKKYTFTLTNFEESYSEFLAQRALYANDSSTGRLYREFSGSVQLEIPAGTVEDTSGNVNKLTTMDLGTIDTLKPEVVKVSSTVDTTNKTETIIFDITDKFMASSAITTTDTSKIHVMVDDTEITALTKQITNIQELRASVGTNTNQLVGYRYTLKLSNFEQASRNADKYVDYSGTVSIKIDANTATDTSGTGNAEATITGDFVDFIKPNISYKYLTTDINKSGKSFQMAFDVTDKYYSGTKLTINDLYIQIADGKNTYNLKDTPVEIALNSDEAITVASMKKTNATSGNVETVTNAVIGHKYVLTISGLEQLEIASGNTTLDYSGIVTVAISANKTTDTSNNGNVATTITSGVDLPGGSGTGTVVDVVKPIWRKSFGGDINWDAGTASVIIKGTDTYYASNSLTASGIRVYSYTGAVKTDITSSVTVTLSSATALNESVTVNGTTSTRQYGVQYTINLAGLPLDKDQVKIVIPAGTLTDSSGNTNDLYETRLYATLMSTASETSPTSAFLGNTALQRQNIESVTFVTSLEGALSNKWDVSSAQDESIWAWYTTSGGVYQVTIGSDEFVCANQDSSYLFAHIGYSESCTTANVLNGLDKFNTMMTTNMSHMFYNTGKEKMITLDLGTSFNTENVTNMSGMFEGCGYKKMTSASFGSGFTTANVTNMSSMFKNFGHDELTSFNLSTIAGASGTGGFSTIKVTNMASMFEGLGYEKMTTMTIGSEFNTSAVTNMNSMFKNCGFKALQSLDCGDLFVTTAVTDMNYMFNGCGSTAMTVLDLGPAFTNIPSGKSTDFMTSCGTSSLVVYAPEAIYSNRVNFKTK